MFPARKPTMLIALALSLPVLGSAQEIIHLDGPGSVTVDASRLVSIPLVASWRVAATDNPRFAETDFDDSAWPSISPGMDRLLADFHAPNELEGRQWIRLHLHIQNATAPLGFHLSLRNNIPFQVFANGTLLPITRGGIVGQQEYSVSWGFFPPQTNDLVLAIRFVNPTKPTFLYFQLEQIEIGQAKAIGNEIDLSRYRLFEDQVLTPAVVSIFLLVCATLSFALWLAQVRHLEYFWLWLSCGMESIAKFALASATTQVQTAFGWYFLFELSNVLSQIALLQFVATIAGQSRGKILRVVQAITFVAYLVHVGSDRVQLMTAFATNFLNIMLIAFLLLGAYRRGRKDCGLLLIPLVLVYVAVLADVGISFKVHLGGVGIRIADIFPLFSIAGITSVILYRFVRVSKDEEIAAGELEAARTVQQLLIPATPPATPGFTVESADLPARQVGGDFFLVLPAADGTADKTLLAVMGDVSGKGLQAAMVVSTIIGGLRMQVSREPAEVLEHLNRMLFGHVAGFATCCIVLIDANGKMRIANAGNPAPYVDGVELGALPGLPLGMILDVHYEESTHFLKLGQQMTLVSDGVIEATNPGKELYGFDRTRDVSVQSAAAIAEAASRFGSGAPQADDITVLTVSYA